MTPKGVRFWAPWLALALLGSAVILLTVSPIVNPPKWDEFIVVYDAHRVACGQVPYRDFFNFIPPGALYILAGLSKVAGGTTLTLDRYASLAVVLAMTLLAAWILNRRGWHPWVACAIAALYPLCIYPFWAVWSHQWLANLCLVALLALLARGGWGLWRWFVAGALAGCALASLQAQGVEALALCGVFVAMEERKRVGRGILACAGGWLSVWGPFGGLLAVQGALGPFIRDTWLWTAMNYSRAGNENSGPVLQDWVWRLGDISRRFSEKTLPGGGLTALGGMLLYCLLAGGAALTIALAIRELVRMVRTRRLESAWQASAVLLTFLELGLVSRGNPNWLHVLFSLFPLWVLWAGVLAGWRGWRRPGVAWTAASLLSLCLAAGLTYHARGLWAYRPGSWEFTDVDRPIRESAVNRFLLTPGVLHDGDTLAAFPEGGEVYLYAAPAAVGYTYFLPLDRHYNDLRDHRIVASQIERNGPRFVLMPADMEREYLDPRSPVAEVLRRDYRRLGRLDLAVVYGRLSMAGAPLPNGLAPATHEGDSPGGKGG
jgi:hypothetical protein